MRLASEEEAETGLLGRDWDLRPTLAAKGEKSAIVVA